MKGALKRVMKLCIMGKLNGFQKKIVAAVFIFFLKKDFIYLVKKKSELQKDGEREGKRERERERSSACWFTSQMSATAQEEP